MSLIFCACGCKKTLEDTDSSGRKRKYILGHNSTGNYICNTTNDFWNKINIKNNDDCWIWLGGLFKTGYGAFHINYKTVLAHRYSYELTYGKILNGMLVLHKCDNKKCCNPKHLFLGTQKDNMDDMINKGRSLFGEKHPQHKLMKNNVEEIKKLYTEGKYSQYNLAKIFNVKQVTIWRIINNVAWRK